MGTVAANRKKSAKLTPVVAGSGDGRSRRWAGYRDDRRRELVNVVIASVRRRGPAVTIDQIAADAGITKPVVYRHFDDKADLLSAAVRRVADLAAAEVIAALESCDGPREMLFAGIERYLALIETEPDLYRFVVHRADASGPLTPSSDYTTLVGLRVARVLGEELRRVGLDSGAAEPWGFGIVGMVFAAADRWLEQATMSRQALAGYLGQLAWAGLSSAYVDDNGDGLPLSSPRHESRGLRQL